MKFFLVFVCISLILGISQARPNPDLGSWFENAWHSVKDFVSPDNMKDVLTKAWKAKSYISPKCHWKATASCSPEGVEKAKEFVAENNANNRKPSKTEIVKFATNTALECWNRKVQEC